MNNYENLKKLYYNPETGLQSADKLYRKAKELGLNVTHKQIKDFLSKQFSAQVFKQTKKNKVYSSIVASGPRANYQIDLMIYDRYQYKQFRYILVVIDVYSRYLSAVPLTGRKLSSIITKLHEIFEKMGVPQNINCDNEFNKGEFNKWMDRLGIKVYYSDPEESNKNAIVERVNGTIARMIQKYRIATGNHNWPAILPKLINNYNHTIHRTIKAKPADVFDGKDVNRQKIIRVEYVFKVGDVVRIKLKRKVFDKGDVLTYSKDTYIIENKVGQRYKLKNAFTDQILKNTFKPYELIKVSPAEIYEQKNEDELEHKAVQEKRLIKRRLNTEGLQNAEENITSRLRHRKPVFQLEHDEFGRIIY